MSWNMLTATEAAFAAGEPRRARAQNIANIRGTHRCLAADGQWREAWTYTYLPELTESESGLSMGERATTGRHLREQAQLEEVLAKARAQGEKAKKKK